MEGRIGEPKERKCVSLARNFTDWRKNFMTGVSWREGEMWNLMEQRTRDVRGERPCGEIM